jgi:chromosome segregation ATPase
MMPEPIAPVEPNGEATELETLRKTVAELTQKAATRKARITELESNASALQVKATEAETRIKALTIDGPVNDLCESISVAPQALRSALESEYRIEMRDGVLTLLNPSDSKPVMQDGKQVAFTAESIKALLLGSKDEAKKKLYNAIIIANRASGAGGVTSQRTTTTPARPQFGLGMSLK